MIRVTAFVKNFKKGAKHHDEEGLIRFEKALEFKLYSFIKI
jgi:hypothetical protein